MIEETRYDKAFSTPILRYRVAEHETLCAALLEDGARMRSEDQGVGKSNHGGWHSSGNLFDQPSAAIGHLRVAVEAATVAAVRRLKGTVDPDDLNLKLFAWMNSNPAGGFNAPHTHPGAHWSGVFYVSQPEVEEGNSGMIEFVSPRSDLSHWRIFGASAFRLKKRMRPQPGDLILFPSYLVHWVYPNDTDEERVTIAFNATFSKRKS